MQTMKEKIIHIKLTSSTKESYIFHCYIPIIDKFDYSRLQLTATSSSFLNIAYDTCITSENGAR